MEARESTKNSETSSEGNLMFSESDELKFTTYSHTTTLMCGTSAR